MIRKLIHRSRRWWLRGFCPSTVGPIPKLDGLVVRCDLRRGHGGDGHYDRDGTWWSWNTGSAA